MSMCWASLVFSKKFNSQRRPELPESDSHGELISAAVYGSSDSLVAQGSKGPKPCWINTQPLFVILVTA